MVELRGLAGEFRDGFHRIVARQRREVDGLVEEVVDLGVVVAGLCGLADACDLFVDLRCAPRRGVFFQMVGVFHTIVFFTKLEKLFDPASFPDQLF